MSLYATAGSISRSRLGKDGLAVRTYGCGHPLSFWNPFQSSGARSRFCSPRTAERRRPAVTFLPDCSIGIVSAPRTRGGRRTRLRLRANPRFLRRQNRRNCCSFKPSSTANPAKGAAHGTVEGQLVHLPALTSTILQVPQPSQRSVNSGSRLARRFWRMKEGCLGEDEAIPRDVVSETTASAGASLPAFRGEHWAMPAIIAET